LSAVEAVTKSVGVDRRLSPLATGFVIFAIGFVASLIGDACHVASGTTAYDWDGVPNIWRSAVWFPFVVGGAVVGAALGGRGLGLPAARKRTRLDAAIGIGAVVALYALTAALRHQPMTVSMALCWAIAFVIWAWWDPSPGSFAIAAGAAVLGPLAEIVIVKLGASHYAPDADGLWGVAPWLTCLYFAAGAVGSGLWRVVSGADSEDPS
jgi:hypothetical protein